MQVIQNLKVTPKEPAEENHDWNPIPVTSGSEQDEKQLCLLEAASNSGQQSMKTSSKRKLFGNPSLAPLAMFKCVVQVGGWILDRPGSRLAEELTRVTYLSCHQYKSHSTIGSKNQKANIWAHWLRERKTLIVYEEISEPEEDY